MNTPEKLKDKSADITEGVLPIGAVYVLELPQLRIVSAAIRIAANKVICPPRHCDRAFHMVVDLLPQEEREHWYQGEQGFVDQFGNFLTRQEAWVVAEKAGQILRRCGGDGVKLYSENLY